MSTHLKHGQSTIDGLLQERDWSGAIIEAIEWCSSSFDPLSVNAPERTISRVAHEAAAGDDDAVRTIVGVIHKDFASRGPGDIAGGIEGAATEAVTTIGPRAVPFLVPLLDDPRWQVATHATKALGTLGAVSVVPLIAGVYSRTAEPEESRAPFPMWKREVRSEASVACTSLFRADPEGFVREASSVEDAAARTMLHAAAMYVVVKLRPGPRTDELRALADELAPESQ